MPAPLPAPFPKHRPRRLRRSETVRDLVRRVHLSKRDVIVPVFVTEGEKAEVSSMPGVFQRPVADAADWLDELADEGFGAYLVFGVVDASKKDGDGSEALSPDNIVCRLLRETKRRGNPMIAITDLCFCEYTDHGHCGPLCGETHPTVDNDATLKLLGEQAVNHAEAGADWIAPSGAMDGMVGAIRSALDQRGHTDTAILSYSVKYAGAFYGPFRDAAHSAPGFGDRRSYQMDAARGTDEAVAEVLADVAEGADLTMVKPAGPYLDVIAAVRAATTLPVVAYQTSGEYAMHVAGEQAGWVDGDAVAMESLLAIKRAGADLIITYHTERLRR
ncbi:MAG: porphobilinogen synthase, partial [Planctomycetota bacterium]